MDFGFWTLRLRNAKGKAIANSAGFGFWIEIQIDYLRGEPKFGKCASMMVSIEGLI
jgi:hypothetical protein